MTHRREKVVIIIPTYNEGGVIENTLQQVLAVTQDLPDHAVELLIFDSASTDNTQAIVQSWMQQYPDQLHLHSESSKTGLGSAYLQAMSYAMQTLQADIVVEFDADLSHQPKYIPMLLDALKTHDVVVGSRYVQGGSIPADWGLHRKFLSMLGNKVARLFLTRRYQDFTSGFRMIRKTTLERILPAKFLSDHYAYKLHLMWLLHQHQALIYEYPVEFVDRQWGNSKLPGNSVADALRVLFVIRVNVIKQWIQRLG